MIACGGEKSYPDGLRALELTKTTLKNKKERESMNQEELDKKLKKQEILVKDEKVWSYTYGGSY